MVPALPNHLLFVFGGSSDFFEEGTPRTFANLSNTAQFISIAGDLKQSKWNVVDPEEPIDNPLPRENSSMVYDESNNRLLVFGGWSDKYMNDVHELNISSITGPQYAIYQIEPELGPYTGNTNCMITGEGFVPNRTYVVEFNAGKYPLTTQARYVSPTQIECVTPEFVSVGPKEASVRVRAERGDLTLTDVPFQFFLNTQSTKTIAFGPGLLENNKCGVPTSFFIQTRNMKNENRTSGSDEFEMAVYTESEVVETNEEEEEITTIVRNPIEYKIVDLENGQYKVEYTSEQPAEVFLDIQYSSEVQKPTQIRGGPFKATFTEDAPAENNTFTGPSMQKYISSRLNEIDSFIKETSEGIDTSDQKFKNERKALLKIKENTSRVDENKEKNLLDLEVIEQALCNFEVEGKQKSEEFDHTKQMIGDMQQLEEDCLDTEKKISNNMKDEKTNCKNELNDFEKSLKKYYLTLKDLQIYTNYNTGVKNAFESIENIEENIKGFKQKLIDFEYYTKMFEMEEGTGGVKKILSKIDNETQAMRKLWEHIKLVQETFENYLKMEWKDVNASDMEDETKSFQKTLTKMKGIDKKSNVFIGINKDIRNWLVFLPLISEMKNPAMTADDDRHWEAIKEHLKQDFTVEDDMKVSMFWDMNIYDPKVREEIEEITDRAK